MASFLTNNACCSADINSGSQVTATKTVIGINTFILQKKKKHPIVLILILYLYGNYQKIKKIAKKEKRDEHVLNLFN